MCHMRHAEIHSKNVCEERRNESPQRGSARGYENLAAEQQFNICAYKKKLLSCCYQLVMCVSPPGQIMFDPVINGPLFTGSSG